MMLHDNFEWDEEKAQKNLTKHAVSFDDAALVLARVFAGLRATYESVERTGELSHFDFFVLSDSNNPQRMPAAVLQAPERPRRQMTATAMRPMATATTAPASAAAKRLSATGVGSDMKRCSTMPSTASCTLNRATRRDHTANGVGRMASESFIVRSGSRG